MKNSDDSSLCGNILVDIHGREIPTVAISKDEEAVLLSDLQQTGVSIYRNNQFAKLSQMKKELDQDFIDHMLEAATVYMLKNRINFTQKEIIGSIENCKDILTNSTTSTPPNNKTGLLKNRTCEASDDEIGICVNDITFPRPLNPTKQFTSEFEAKTADSDSRSASSGFSEGLSNKGERRKKYKKMLKYDTDQQEFDVLVTHIDKANCCWVRDKASNEQMEEIHQRVNQEAAKREKSVPNNDITADKLYMAKDGGGWFRCRIVKVHPLTVLFVDRGSTAEVAEVRKLSDDVAAFPSLAARITFRAWEYEPRLQDEIRVRRLLLNKDGTMFVNVLTKTRRDPFPSASTVVGNITRQLQRTNTEEKETPAFFSKPRPLHVLQSDQTVMIIHEKDGVFYLRTRDCFEKLKSIEEEIDKFSTESAAAPNLKPDQVVLYHSEEDKKYYRAIVNKICKDDVDIELLDYVDSLTTNKQNLRTISERLSKEPLTYVEGGKLSEFENSELDAECKKLIGEYIKSRKKFIVSLGFDDELDLSDGVQFLSERLQKLTSSDFKATRRIYLKDVKTLKPELGLKSYICGFYNNSKELSLIPIDEFEKYADYILKTEIEDESPYQPTIQEVCLCYFIEYWYRCVVTRIFDEECEVLLLDFGSIQIIRKENLRKPDDDITRIPALAIPCVLTNIPQDRETEMFLRESIHEGEIYKADIKKIDGKCHVEMPTVYAKVP